MEQIKFKNSENTQYTFGRTFPYAFEDLRGLNTAPIIPKVDESFNQDGKNFYGTRFGPRMITFAMWVQGTSVLDFKQKVAALNDLFNPTLGLGTFTYTNDIASWQIQGFVSAPPERRSGKGNAVTGKFDIGIYCPDPALTDTIETQTKLEGFTNGLTLPITIPITIGQLGPETVIEYDGTIPAPILIEFRGACSNPSVTKEETGEKVEVEETVAAGDSLFVYTKPNAIDVYRMVSGVKTTAFSAVTADSEYPVLTRGDNTFSFVTGSGTPEVYLYWRAWFNGVA